MSHPDEDRPRPPATHVLGQDVSQLSVEDLGARIAALTDEIARLEEARRLKQASRAAAAAFFRPPPG
jgi:uncharacterized small protein (DUF1192 family)